MRVLVAVASKHGSTRELAMSLGRYLAHHGLDVDVRDIPAIHAIDEYDAVVIGSAVYAGRWRREARHFVKRHAGELINRPVWLFSSGPLGDPSEDEDGGVRLESIVKAIGAHEHRVFDGALDRSRLNPVERGIVHMVGAPQGDFRNWADVADWAVRISDELDIHRAWLAGGLARGGYVSTEPPA